MQVCADAESDASSSAYTVHWDVETHWDDAQFDSENDNILMGEGIIIRRL